ncbi:MAG: FAD-binding oxidoreductase [Acidimicrobiales bacterium]
MTCSRRLLAPDPSGCWDEATVVGVWPENDTATTLRLELPEVADFLPGQYYLVRLGIPQPPGAIEQPYSVSSAPYPSSREMEITVREVKGGRASPLLVREVQVGDLLQLRGPFGFLTWSEQDGGPVMLIGAGSGVSPLMSIAQYAAARHLRVPMSMLCSSREMSSVLFEESLEHLRWHWPWLSVTHTLTRRFDRRLASYGRRIDAAMIKEIVSRLGWEGSDVRFFVAGPAEMVEATRAAIVAVFGPDADVNSEDHT